VHLAFLTSRTRTSATLGILETMFRHLGADPNVEIQFRRDQTETSTPLAEVYHCDPTDVVSDEDWRVYLEQMRHIADLLLDAGADPRAVSQLRGTPLTALRRTIQMAWRMSEDEDKLPGWAAETLAGAMGRLLGELGNGGAQTAEERAADVAAELRPAARKV